MLNPELERRLEATGVATHTDSRENVLRTAAGHTEAVGDTSRRVDIGTRVRIERDETRYPSRGTWPQFRGRTGAVVEINRAGRGPTEYGVCFTKVTPGGPKDNRAFNWDPGAVAWFKRYEITHIS